MGSLHHIRHHARRIHYKNKKFFLNPFFWVIILLLALSFYKLAFSSALADNAVVVNNINSTLKNSKLDIMIQNPNNEGITTEFPDGRSYIEVNVNAMKSDGSPLVNEPIIVDKSSSVIMTGPTNTGDGQITLKFASNRSLTDHVRIKLKNCLTVKKDLQIRFAEDTSLRDLTDKNSFVAGTPILFEVQIKPWMTDHLQKAQVNFIYTRRVNKWGFWVSTRRVVPANLECNDGVCHAMIGSSDTRKERNQSGNFTYQFVFKDGNGKLFSKSYKAKLKNP